MVKILVCGKVENNISILAKRVSKLKGQFHGLFCCSTFFPKELQDKQDIITYFTTLVSVLKLMKVIVFGEVPTWFSEYSATISEGEESKELLAMNLISLKEWMGFFSFHDLSIFYYNSEMITQNSNISASSSRKRKFNQSSPSSNNEKENDNIGDNDESTNRDDQFQVAFEQMISGDSSSSSLQIPADLLFSNVWPELLLSNLSNDSLLPNADRWTGKSNEEIRSFVEYEGSSGEVRLLASNIFPRYHFSSSKLNYNNNNINDDNNCNQLLDDNFYYERVPFSYSPIYSHSCRFISLPSLLSKEKWLYAANIEPISKMNKEELDAITIASSSENPYFTSTITETHDQNQHTSKKLKLDEAYNKFGSFPSDNINYFFGKNFKPNNQPQQRRFKKIDNCWFCLNGEKVEDHLITNIGDESYLALPKGGLVDDHILIIPIDHITLPSLISPALENEIFAYKRKLREYAKSKGKEMLFFERNAPTQYGMVHYHIQCIPVPQNCSKALLQTFLAKGSSSHLQFIEITDPNDDLANHLRGKRYYFLAELPDQSRLLHFVRKSERHPINFGRDVAAEFLNLKNRANWKECAVSKDEEIKLASTFKHAFSVFNK